MQSSLCPLCESHEAQLFHQDDNKRSQRPYYRCDVCRLVFVPSKYFLSAEAEKAEYDLHQNQLADEGYLRFLNRFWGPVQGYLNQPSHILEFGCGPGPALARMMEEVGHDVRLYDHFYYPNEDALAPETYDAITSTEVFEHLHDPKHVLEQCLSWLKPNGYLGIMTKLVADQAAFARWHYKNDLTHVVFFSQDTFRWIARTYNLDVVFLDKDVVLLRKLS
jgi:2-polyprenyl-3-methyl-5-hydroxy-6-metoxy-1,4-benzoquinol methylase